MEKLADTYDERFEPCKYLLELARKDKTFNPESSESTHTLSSKQMERIQS
jgi:hypothetical protein